MRGCACVCMDNEDNTLVTLKWYRPVALQRTDAERGGGITLDWSVTGTQPSGDPCTANFALCSYLLPCELRWELPVEQIILLRAETFVDQSELRGRGERRRRVRGRRRQVRRRRQRHKRGGARRRSLQQAVRLGTGASYCQSGPGGTCCSATNTIMTGGGGGKASCCCQSGQSRRQQRVGASRLNNGESCTTLWLRSDSFTRQDRVKSSC